MWSFASNLAATCNASFDLAQWPSRRPRLSVVFKRWMVMVGSRILGTMLLIGGGVAVVALAVAAPKVLRAARPMVREALEARHGRVCARSRGERGIRRRRGRPGRRSASGADRPRGPTNRPRKRKARFSHAGAALRASNRSANGAKLKPTMNAASSGRGAAMRSMRRSGPMANGAAKQRVAGGDAKLDWPIQQIGRRPAWPQMQRLQQLTAGEGKECQPAGARAGAMAQRWRTSG